MENSATIAVPALLSSAIVARITPQTYNESTQVLTETFKVAYHTKFDVTPKNGTQEWGITNKEPKAGYLKKATVVDISIPNEAWKKLKEVIDNAQGGDTIIIDGEIKATNDVGNSGQIIIRKDLTIKGKNKDTAILNANKDTGGAICIGSVTHGIGNSVDMINCLINKNTATNSDGGIYIGRNGSFTMDGKDSKMTGNTAAGEGWAVYIGEDGTFDWKAGTITDNGDSSKAVKNANTDGSGFDNPFHYTAY